MALFKKKVPLADLIFITVGRTIAEGRFESEEPRIDSLNLEAQDPEHLLGEAERQRLIQEYQPFILVLQFSHLCALLIRQRIKGSVGEHWGSAVAMGFHQAGLSEDQSEAAAYKYIGIQEEYMDALGRIADEKRVKEQGEFFGLCEVFTDRVLPPPDRITKEYAVVRTGVFSIATQLHRNVEGATRQLHRNVQILP